MSVEQTTPKQNTAHPANAMSDDEVARFLAEKREARLATIRSDGSIHLTPVWYLYDGGKVKLCLEKDRLHLGNLRRRPHATILIDEDRRPTEGYGAAARAVMFAGHVDIVDEVDATEAVRQKLLGRYIGDDLNREDSPFRRAQDAGPPKHYLLIVLTPDRTLSWDFTKQA